MQTKKQVKKDEIAKSDKKPSPGKKRLSEAGTKTARKRSRESVHSVRIAFLGGINEIGKNMILYEYGEDMFLVDCGMSFPDQDMLGVDLVLPDFSYVEKNADKIRGIVVTHGHEDHIGGLPYLLKIINTPVYGTKLTIGLIQGRLREHGILSEAKLNVVKPGQRIVLGAFNIECIHVNHSIPDALALAIRCEAGTIIQTGDFKIDSTPIDGEMIDLSRLSEIGKEKVLCLLSDSTNAERPGYTESEKKVGESFETLFRKADGKRILVATFSSNIHRIQQIMDVAGLLGKKVALSGRSLENVVRIGQDLGYLKIPDGLMITIDMLRRYNSDEVVIITTGSQGEPLSALSRMAFSDHRSVEINPSDCVIISATPIPGNEKTVSKVINELMKLGAEVVYEKMYDVHVSGHACQEELKMMMGLVKPKYFIPVHGEQKHLRKHAALALSMGIEKKNIFIADIGSVAEISGESIRQAAPVPAGKVFVDGYGVGDVGNAVIKERKHLAQDGLIIVAAAIDTASGKILSGPDVVSRGFVYVREAEALIDDARKLALSSIEYSLNTRKSGLGDLKARLRDELSGLMYERTKRSPMILPVILEA